MEATTLFSWGYWGWGGTSAQFVRAVDAVEASRGFEPPVFVDVRIRRTARATGFNGKAFERLIGSERHYWMKLLGNRLANDPDGRVDLVDPGAASDLLEVALERAGRQQRVLFFCACAYPGIEGQPQACHRATVTRLVLEEARRRAAAAQITEWPGGSAIVEGLRITVSHPVFRSLAAGRSSIPLGDLDDAELVHKASLPWGSTVTVHDERFVLNPLRLMTGAARFRTGEGWFLPVFRTIEPTSRVSPADIAMHWRHDRGIVDHMRQS